LALYSSRFDSDQDHQRNRSIVPFLATICQCYGIFSRSTMPCMKFTECPHVSGEFGKVLQIFLGIGSLGIL
jgi:hypothetical protein